VWEVRTGNGPHLPDTGVQRANASAREQTSMTSPGEVLGTTRAGQPRADRRSRVNDAIIDGTVGIAQVNSNGSRRTFDAFRRTCNEKCAISYRMDEAGRACNGSLARMMFAPRILEKKS
jgi:hypothetical protein